eukprot:Lithocolla_globosa_v1_NODE_19_length_9697_cov_21.310620.p4 type:complete len:283 gc:universal NODE_19_length_9697_cov_21.310620:3703-4551(+)
MEEQIIFLIKMVVISKHINSVTVKPIQVPTVPLENVRGSDLFPSLFSNIFICSKKRSGKTSTIATILKKCADKNSKVVVFCSTMDKDDNWVAIRNYLDKKKIPNDFFSSIHENNALAQLIDEMSQTQSEDEESEDEEPPVIVFGDETLQIKRKKRKPKIVSPKYILVLDDISTELRDKQIARLLKIHRHLKSKVILSSQWYNDLEPSSRRQIDYYLIFNGINEEKLEQLYKNADLSITYEQFKILYRTATSEKYNFLYIDVNGDNYRHNFNKGLAIENHVDK